MGLLLQPNCVEETSFQQCHSLFLPIHLQMCFIFLLKQGFSTLAALDNHL